MIAQIILVSTVLAIVLLVPAYADSPLAQYNSEVPISNIQCSDEKVLLQSTSGKPYCMSESMATKLADRGFLIVDLDEKIKFEENILESKYIMNNKIDDSASSSDSIEIKHDETQILSNTIIYTADKYSGGHGSIGFTMRPFNSLEIPDSISIGETVHVRYTVSWSHPNGTSILDGIIDVDKRDEFVSSHLTVQVPDEFTVLNENKIFLKMYADTYTPHTSTIYDFVIPYSEETISGTIDIRLDKPMMYDLDEFNVGIGFNDAFLVTDKTEFGVILRERDYFTDSIDIQTLNLMSATTGDGRYDELYLEETTHIPAVKSQIPDVFLANENMYLDKSHWEKFAEFLHYVSQTENVSDFRSWLIDNGMTEKFVNDFFAEYPEFAKIKTDFVSGLMAVPVFAETISPLKQFQMGIPLDMIECSDGKILMKFPSGKPACVTSKTSEKLETRGFVLVVSNSPKIDNMANPNKSTHSEINESSSFLRIHDVKFELHGYPVVGETDELTLTLKHVDSYGFYEDEEGKLTPAPYEDTFGSLKPVKLNLLGAGEHPEYRLYDIVSNIGSDDPDIFTSYDHATETIIAELGKTYIVKAKVEILKEGFVNFFATTLDDEYIGLSYVISADESMSYREYKKHNETYLDHLLPVRKEFNSEPEPKLTEEPQPPPPGYVEPPPRSFTNKDLKQIAREFVHHKYTEDEMVHDFYAMRFSNQEITDFLKKYMNYTQTQINTFPIESELHTQSSVTG